MFKKISKKGQKVSEIDIVKESEEKSEAENSDNQSLDNVAV